MEKEKEIFDEAKRAKPAESEKRIKRKISKEHNGRKMGDGSQANGKTLLGK